MYSFDKEKMDNAINRVKKAYGKKISTLRDAVECAKALGHDVVLLDTPEGDEAIARYKIELRAGDRGGFAYKDYGSSGEKTMIFIDKDSTYIRKFYNTLFMLGQLELGYVVDGNRYLEDTDSMVVETEAFAYKVIVECI